MKGASPLVQWLFSMGLAAGRRRFDKGLIGAPYLYNALVFKKVPQGTRGP